MNQHGRLDLVLQQETHEEEQELCRMSQQYASQ
ncbi:hypothetical protein PHMEG_00019712 [Phytophthora megakarya]|uniref:Uncharacterized protein n=1 Tax=Phytophthora megakarya TaxID=4795 RepID=A0A225VTI7_9STRA|nr:hypothetical protein PHMEG_00019712 [Phytophthora megakarya]